MTYTSTIPGGFLERLAAYEKADEDKRERKAARRKQLYTTFKQEVLTPIGNVASKYPAQTAGAVVGGLLTGGLGGSLWWRSLIELGKRIHEPLGWHYHRLYGFRGAGL